MATENPRQKRKQDQDDQYKCIRCGERFESERELRRHEEDNHVDRSERDPGSRRGTMGQ